MKATESSLASRLIVGAVFLLLAALIQTQCSQSHKESEARVEACAQRGVKYFMDVGSYPRLSDGRIPYEVARERCLRTLKAF